MHSWFCVLVGQCRWCDRHAGTPINALEQRHQNSDIYAFLVLCASGGFDRHSNARLQPASMHSWFCVLLVGHNWRACAWLTHRNINARTQRSNSDLMHSWFCVFSRSLWRMWQTHRHVNARTQRSNSDLMHSWSCVFVGHCEGYHRHIDGSMQESNVMQTVTYMRASFCVLVDHWEGCDRHNNAWEQ